VIFTLPEDQLQTVAKHMKASTLEVDAYSRDDQTKLATGKLETIDNQIDQTNGTAKLKAVFDNKDNHFAEPVRKRESSSGDAENSVVLPTAANAGPQGRVCIRREIGQHREARNVTISLTQAT